MGYLLTVTRIQTPHKCDVVSLLSAHLLQPSGIRLISVFQVPAPYGEDADDLPQETDRGVVGGFGVGVVGPGWT